MLQRVFTCALLAGLVAGILTTFLQLSFVTPIILAGEGYEGSAGHAGQSPHAHEHSGLWPGAETGSPAWAPSEGMERTAFTALATVVSSIGFALMLVAVAMLSPGELSLHKGFAFGLAGFAATSLLPSFGLPPELPGSASEALTDRQAWWIATAVSSAAGLHLLAYARLPLKVLGIAALAVPQLIGAPDAGPFVSTAPAELAARFVSHALVVQAAMWATLGAACGWFWQRLVVDGPVGRPARTHRQTSSV